MVGYAIYPSMVDEELSMHEDAARPGRSLFYARVPWYLLLLELSSVANPHILFQYGIDTIVDVPTVGENLQVQMNKMAYPSAPQSFGDETGNVAAQLKTSLTSYAAQVASVNNNVTS
ncbi:hypothetical protein BKA67DRAFT_648174 [Truncatella angustata]|uniref:Uncharacterized protein n=1 Tax=Truncatella angustata TaxID=152316 RepID=A0A9P8UHJ2_9PEZI|nr:uncharacterized protein BKA67DRAFT_648174 [Truncatella angustata]KAH6652301.1 hypothetical protein BKA67DRAFT_648174 [Truncatella angustata]